jgi:hypothetical protein
MEKGGRGTPILPGIGLRLVRKRDLVAAFEQRRVFKRCKRKTKRCRIELREMLFEGFAGAPAVK